MKFVELVIDLENEVSIKRGDVKEKSGGIDGIINDFLVKFYLREKGLKLKDELGSGFAIRDGDWEKIFFGGV